MHLWFLGDPRAPSYVGNIDLVPALRGVSLTYADSWLNTGFPLSEDMPLVPQPFLPSKKERAAGSVDDARPDRWGERVIRALDKPKRLSLLEYLYFAGDDRFGALGISLQEAAYVARQAFALPNLQDVEHIHRLVQKVAAGEPVPEHERRLLSPGRTLGGAKPKSVIEIDGQPWVLKFADDYDIDWPMVEHATMSLARRCGLTVAETRAITFAQGKSAVAVRRFDRRAGAAGVSRIHALSMDVALRAAGETPGYPELASALRRIGSRDTEKHDRRELFARMVFNILVDNTDDHEKNHALLRLDDGQYRLSPAFDVVPTNQNLGTQSIRVGKNEMDSTLDNAMSECAAFGLRKDDAAALVSSICVIVDGWQDAFRLSGVSDRDIEVCEPFLNGSKAEMRREFALWAMR